jgi:N utilization substance protein B
MGSRRRGREIALQVLCTLDRQPELSAAQGLHLYFKHLTGSDVDDDDESAATDATEARSKPAGGRTADPYVEQRQFAEELVEGVHGRLTTVDALITHCSRNWRLSRMSWVDRNLLRLAGYELIERGDIPARVVLNEAIEIARRYSTSESSGFVNGILDRMLHELGRREAVSDPAQPSL